MQFVKINDKKNFAKRQKNYPQPQKEGGMYAIIEKLFVAYLRYSGEIIAGEICHRRQFFNQSQREFFYEPDCEHEKTGKTRQLQKFCFHCNSPLPKKIFQPKSRLRLVGKNGRARFFVRRKRYYTIKNPPVNTPLPTFFGKF